MTGAKYPLIIRDERELAEFLQIGESMGVLKLTRTREQTEAEARVKLENRVTSDESLQQTSI